MKNKKGISSVIATCHDCGEEWHDLKTARRKSRNHAIKTGHKVVIESSRFTQYNDKINYKEETETLNNEL